MCCFTSDRINANERNTRPRSFSSSKSHSSNRCASSKPIFLALSKKFVMFSLDENWDFFVFILRIRAPGAIASRTLQKRRNRLIRLSLLAEDDSIAQPFGNFVGIVWSIRSGQLLDPVDDVLFQIGITFTLDLQRSIFIDSNSNSYHRNQSLPNFNIIKE